MRPPAEPVPQPARPGAGPPPGRVGEVLAAFLKLGLTAFGGPVAHLAHFRAECVARRRWLDDGAYAELVALCQFLPGPSSSQVGLALGLMRAGVWGGLAAWLAFTLPSALVLLLFAQGLAAWPGLADAGALQGLKLATVAVVAQALWGMACSLCPDAPRRALALGAGLLAAVVPGGAGQLGALALGAAWGACGWAPPPDLSGPPGAGLGARWGRRTGAALLSAFGLLLLALPALAAALASPGLAAVSAFYQAGALVFGGGHAVLPLLQAAVVPPGWVPAETFLAGYGAAQLMPGPLFSVAAFLGAAMPAPLGGGAGAAALLVAIFLPGFLLVAGVLPFWARLRARAGVHRVVAGLNAAVVGLLGAALLHPVGSGAVHSAAELGLVVLATLLLVRARIAPLPGVLGVGLAGWALAAWGG